MIRYRRPNDNSQPVVAENDDDEKPNNTYFQYQNLANWSLRQCTLSYFMMLLLYFIITTKVMHSYPGFYNLLPIATLPIAIPDDEKQNTTLLRSNSMLQSGDYNSTRRNTIIPPEFNSKQHQISYVNYEHQTSWDRINRITSQHPNSKLSGSLFLYPLQQHVLSYIIQTQIALINNSTDTFRICETGFGAGHSTSFFLSLDRRIEVVTFDKFDRSYQLPIVNYLQEKYKNRLNYVIGDSCETVPEYFKKIHQQKCDFLHGSSLCKTDNIDLITYSSKCKTILSSTAMHSLTDRAVYFGPNAQWRILRDKHCISDITCFEMEPNILDKEYIFLKGKSTGIISHKFCVAWNTRVCSYHGEGQSRDCNHNKDQGEDLFNICTDARVPVPV